MLGDIELHIIRITESWVTTDISDAELGMAGYVMFKKDSIGRTGDGFILYIKKIHPGLWNKIRKRSIMWSSFLV